MALVKCEDCGREVSTEAVACPNCGRPMTAAAQAPAVTGPPTEQVGNWLYGLLVLGCTFVPAIGHQLAPGGEVGEKKDEFFAIYIATFPLSLAATFIFLMLLLDWFDNDRQRAFAAAVAIVVSAVWGIGFGKSYADLNTISQLHGPFPAVLAELAFLALFAYAHFYGWVLFIAGWVSSFFAALWIRNKLEQVQKLLA